LYSSSCFSIDLAAAQRGVGRIGEQGHDGVPDVFVDEAAVGRDYRLHVHQVGVEEVEVFLRAHRFRQRGEIPDVGEEDGHLALDLLPEFDLADVLDAQQVEELARDEAAVGIGGGAQPLAQGIGVLAGGSGRCARRCGHEDLSAANGLCLELESK
jgi:hypothetical protein